MYFYLPPSAAVVVLSIMNSISGQSSERLAYLVGINPTASKPIEDVRGPSSFTAYRRAVLRFTNLLRTYKKYLLVS